MTAPLSTETQLEEWYDVAVIGAGMCGTAAAKYLVQSATDAAPPLRVVLIGPDEALPSERPCARAFSAHADEGRITRRCDPDPVWAELAVRSIDRYAAIEKQSGIHFHSPVGFVAVGHADGPFLARVCDVAESQGLGPHVRRVQGPILEAALPFLHVEHENAALLEDGSSTGAGYISPRALVTAQLVLFQHGGGQLIRQQVERVELLADMENNQHGHDGCIVTLASGDCVPCRRVLVAAGACTALRQLLPIPAARGGGYEDLDLDLRTQTIVRLQLNTNDVERLENMPCVICKFGHAPFGVAADVFDSCYLLPPIRYPGQAGEGLKGVGVENDASRSVNAGADGAHWIKIGHGKFFERPLQCGEKALAWWQGAGTAAQNTVANPDTEKEESLNNFADEVARALLSMLHKLVPGLQPEAVLQDRCVYTCTSHGRPYIGLLDGPGGCVGCCVGGNGYAAKSSDEIGRLAAEMMLAASKGDDWGGDKHMPKDVFRPIRRGATMNGNKL